MFKPQNKAQLHGFIDKHFGLCLPDKSFTAGHSTPFDFVADAFFHPDRHLAAWANRSGLKTLGSSVIAALEFLFTEQPLDGRVLAGSEDQAKNLYKYWSQWCSKGPLAALVKGDICRGWTRLTTGNFEVLTASAKRVRGGKVQRLFRDEIDEMDPEIYGASVGMLDSRPGLPARSIDTSTWHHAMGPMGQLVAEAEKRGIKLHKWGIWESIEHCPVDRHDNGRGCAVCPLGEVCLAKARQLDPRAEVGVASLCAGLFSVSDAITQIRQWSKQQWEAEAECRRPTLEGTVYPQFDRAIHVLPDLNFKEGLPVYRAIDFGLNKFVCLWIQEGKKGEIYVIDEYWSEQNRLADNAKAILKIEKDQAVDGVPMGAHATFVDPAGRNRNDQTGYSACQVLKGLGIPCTYNTSGWATEVKNGLNLVRGALSPATGSSRIFIAGACKQLITAFESYRNKKVNGIYIDEPVKPQEWDHGPDAFRYYIVNRHARSRWSDSQWSATGG